MARDQFGNLSDSEVRVLNAATTGDVAYCGTTHSMADPMPTAEGPANRPDSLSARLIGWLCADSDALKLIPSKGIQVQGAYISTPLDLSFVTVPFPLAFAFSHFPSRVDLRYSTLKHFYVSDSQLSGIVAEGMHDLIDFTLYNVTSLGEIDLIGGDIAGDLTLRGSSLQNPSGTALGADRLDVGCDVFMDDGFNADGE